MDRAVGGIETAFDTAEHSFTPPHGPRIRTQICHLCPLSVGQFNSPVINHLPLMIVRLPDGKSAAHVCEKVCFI